MEKFTRYYLTIDDDFNIIHASRDFLEYTGKEYLSNLCKVVPDHDMTNLRNVLFATEPGESSLVCFRIRTRRGELSWIAATIEKPEHDSGDIKMDLSDIQSMKSGGVDSHFDKMTGLYSKAAIIEYAKEVMGNSPARPFYFFLMDIDNFKSINDSYGHLKGDEAIISVAQITRDYVGDHGVVGRFGGDEFMLVLDGVSTEPELREILRDIRYTVRDKYSDEQGNYTITVSMGGALFPNYADNYEKMFMLADKMLYLAKTKGRDRYIIYTPDVHGQIHFDGKVMTISQQLQMDKAKNDLIMILMDELLIKKSVTFRDALERVLKVYGVNEAFVLGQSDPVSVMGLRGVLDESSWHTEDVSIDLSEIAPEDYHSLFNGCPLKILNIFDLQKDDYHKFADFMIKHDYRVMLVYRMTIRSAGGYILFTSATGSTSRFSETDFSDLTYFCRMAELSGICP
jgi:diguanylate cyclase (GGDEF)-like protein